MITSDDGRRRILTTIGGQYIERWPEEQVRAFFHTQELSYVLRIELGTFLYGNLRDSDLVFAALHDQLGPDSADHDHMRRWLADLASGKYDDRYYSARARLLFPQRCAQPRARATAAYFALPACMGGRVRARAAEGGALADAGGAARGTRNVILWNRILRNAVCTLLVRYALYQCCVSVPCNPRL